MERTPGRFHFVGIAGSGMSALAQFLARKGAPVSGSDRSFDRGLFPESRAQLEALGITLHPQDGSGVEGAGTVVLSTAIEPSIPDVAEAQRLGVTLLHRSEVLAALVATHRSIAITGTSGKSTTVAMVFEILKGLGQDPGLITGGDLRALQAEGHWGNAWAGESDLLVLEADESDGSVVRYQPALGVVLNLQKDHKAEDEVLEMFRTFRLNCREHLVVAASPDLADLHPGAITFGPGSSWTLEAFEDTEAGSRFQVRGVAFELPVPGRHNAENALAALATCAALGLSLEAMVAPLARFQGVARRFQEVGTARGITVVDDFGHNPAKVAASLATAASRSRRVLAVFQPHGYGPLRFLRTEFVRAFAASLRPQDRLLFLPVFYAGGTVNPTPTSEEVVCDLVRLGSPAEAVADRAALVARIAAEAREGDLVIVMGARDPSLSALCREILAGL